MKALAIDLLEWQKRFGSEEACGEALARQRWPEGFRCPRCGHDHGYTISTRQSYECSSCHYQASLTAGTSPSFSICARRAIVEGSMLTTTRPGML